MNEATESTRVRLTNFPPSWFADGEDLIRATLTAQLEVFGAMAEPLTLSKNMKEAEGNFVKAADANCAVEVLNGADFRSPDEVDKEVDPRYEGLVAELNTGKLGRMGAGQSSWVGKAAGGANQPRKVPARIVNEGCPHSKLVGVWKVAYEDGSGHAMTYSVTEAGDVRIGKKRWSRLVEACSPQDFRQDTNYMGDFLLDNAHGEGTWEYVWVQNGEMHVHHFSEGDTGMSPRGSSQFWGSGVGTLAGEAPAIQPPPEASVPPPTGDLGGGLGAGGAKAQMPTSGPTPNIGELQPDLAEFEGVWTVTYDSGENGPQYTICATGEVTVGKKRKLQMVKAASPDASRSDLNYALDGIFLLDDAHREGTWEYLWMENGRLIIHHFTEYDDKISPLGSPNFWGSGQGHPPGSAPPGMGMGMGMDAPQGGVEIPPPMSMSTPGMGQGPLIVPLKRQANHEVSQTSGAKGSYKRLRTGGARTQGGNDWSQPWDEWGGGGPIPSHYFHMIPPQGTWQIAYWAGGEMVYHFEEGHCRVSKKRWVPMIEAGSPEDPIKDPNYMGCFLLNNVHREGTWEYLWLEQGRLVIHHFTADDQGWSPLGSPNFYGIAQGVPQW